MNPLLGSDWIDDHSQVYVETTLQPEKVPIWCGLQEAGWNETASSERYRSKITGNFVYQWNNHDVEKYELQQGASTCHTTHPTIDWLKEKLGNRVNCPPTRKSIVRAEKSETMDYLEETICCIKAAIWI